VIKPTRYALDSELLERDYYCTGKGSRRVFERPFGRRSSRGSAGPEAMEARVRAIYTIGHSNHPIQDASALGAARRGPRRRRRSHPLAVQPAVQPRELARESRRGRCRLRVSRPRARARATDDSSTSRRRYERLARTAPFQQGIERVTEAAAIRRVALMCAEKDPIGCHRAILVCPALAARGLAPLHIHCRTAARERTPSSASGCSRSSGSPPATCSAIAPRCSAEAYRRRGRELGYERRPGTRVRPSARLAVERQSSARRGTSEPTVSTFSYG